MKKILAFIFLTFFIKVGIYSQGFDSYFLNHQGKVCYNSGIKIVILDRADAKSFVFDDKKRKVTNAPYGRDKNYVFYRDGIVDGADAKKFRKIDGSEGWAYMRDDQTVYYKGNVVHQADPKAFRVYPSFEKQEDYARDKSFVYHNGTRTTHDLATFKMLEQGYTLDKNGVYFDDKVLDGSSSDNYAQQGFFMVTSDKVFYETTELPMYDAATFQALAAHAKWITDTSFQLGFLTKDKNGIYINHVKVNELDAATCEVIDEMTVKDKNGIYSVSVDDKALQKLQRLDLNPTETEIEQFNLGCDMNVTLFNDGQKVYLDRREISRGVLMGAAHAYQVEGVDANTIEPYAVHQCYLIFRDKDSFFRSTRNKYEKLSIRNKDVRIVYFNEGEFIIQTVDGLFKIQTEISTITADADSYIYVPGKSFRVGPKKEMENTAFFTDKSCIAGFRPCRPVTAEEYKEYQKYAIPTAEWDRQRLEILEKSLKE